MFLVQLSNAQGKLTNTRPWLAQLSCQTIYHSQLVTWTQRIPITARLNAEGSREDYKEGCAVQVRKGSGSWTVHKARAMPRVVQSFLFSTDHLPAKHRMLRSAKAWPAATLVEALGSRILE